MNSRIKFLVQNGLNSRKLNELKLNEVTEGLTYLPISEHFPTSIQSSLVAELWSNVVALKLPVNGYSPSPRFQFQYKINTEELYNTPKWIS